MFFHKCIVAQKLRWPGTFKIDIRDAMYTKPELAPLATKNMEARFSSFALSSFIRDYPGKFKTYRHLNRRIWKAADTTNLELHPVVSVFNAFLQERPLKIKNWQTVEWRKLLPIHGCWATTIDDVAFLILHFSFYKLVYIRTWISSIRKCVTIIIHSLSRHSLKFH